jgi:hypothetical protein
MSLMQTETTEAPTEGQAETSPVDGATPPLEGVAPPEQSERPEWLPEKYKTPEDLAKAYGELETKLGKRNEDLKAELIGEVFKDRPEKPGDYTLPETIDPSDAGGVELLEWWSKAAWERGMSQDEFEAGIEQYRKAVMGSQPDLDGERKKLGDNANDRINAASAFVRANFPDDVMPAMHRLFESAEGVKAMEIVMEKLKDRAPTGDAPPRSGLTETDLRQMMQDPRYSDPSKRDPGYVQKVTEGFQKLYGS